jgi:signal transduction histidine kinase
MSKRSRAYLRHQSERWKKRVKKYDVMPYVFAWPTKPPTEPDPKTVGKIAATRKPCACYACTEPWGPEGTRAQEKRRAAREIHDQMGDLT